MFYISSLFLIYEPITLGLRCRRILRFLAKLPTIVGNSLLFQYFYGVYRFPRDLLGYGLVGILWALTFPLLFHWSYVKPLYFYEFANDFYLKLINFHGIIGHSVLLNQTNPSVKTTSLIMAIISMILSLIPFLQIGYYMTTWHCLTPASLLAVYMTNPEEAFGFKECSWNTWSYSNKY